MYKTAVYTFVNGDIHLENIQCRIQNFAFGGFKKWEPIPPIKTGGHAPIILPEFTPMVN